MGKDIFFAHFFSLGNFVGFRTLLKKGKLVQFIIAEIRFNPDGKLLGAGIIPLKMDGAEIYFTRWLA